MRGQRIRKDYKERSEVILKDTQDKEQRKNLGR